MLELFSARCAILRDATAEHRRLEEARSRRRRNGGAGGRTSPSASGARCARTTRPTARRGTICRSTTPRCAPTAGATTACSASATTAASSCFCVALWNGADPILKERLFGLSGNEGQPRRGRQGALLVPRRDADLQLRACALQVSAGGVPLRGAPRARARGEQGRSRAGDPRHRGVRRRPLLRRRGRVREGGRRRRPRPHHGHQPRARRGAARRAAAALVSQHVELDAGNRAARDGRAREPSSERVASSRRARRTSGAYWLHVRGRRRAALHGERLEREAALGRRPTTGRT